MKTEYNKACEILKHRSYVVKYKNKDYTIIFKEAMFGEYIAGFFIYINSKSYGTMEVLVDTCDLIKGIDNREQYIKDNYKIWIDRFGKYQEVQNDRQKP